MDLIDELKLWTSVVGAGAVAYPLVRWIAIRAMRPAREYIAGQRRTVTAVERMEGEVSAIRRRVDTELGPNGGGSIKDQVTQIAARQAAVFDSMARPAFEADGAGQFRSVNRAFERLTAYSSRDLLGMGWVNLLHDDDRERFMLAWAHAIRDQRIMRLSCRIVTGHDRELEVCVDAVPLRAADGATAIGWYGVIDMEAA